MEKPLRLKWKWCLLMVLGIWILSVAGYWTVSVVCRGKGFTCRQDFTFVHTFLAPAMLLVALIPLSFPQFVSSKWLMPGLAIWEGVMIPGVCLVGRWSTDLGSHCDKVAMLSGTAAFCLLNAIWAISRLWRRVVTFGPRKLRCSIQAAA